MKRTILIITACLASFGPLRAQESIDEVLLLVEQASKELQAQRKLTEAQKLEAKTGNSLENPSVEFENLWRRILQPAGSGQQLRIDRHAAV